MSSQLDSEIFSQRIGFSKRYEKNSLIALLLHHFYSQHQKCSIVQSDAATAKTENQHTAAAYSNVIRIRNKLNEANAK